MHDRLEAAARARGGKDDASQAPAIEGAIGGDDFPAESADNGLESRRPRHDRLACEHVCVDHRDARLPEPRHDVALPRRNAPGQADSFHPALNSAAVMVLRSTIAMVRGPTPPGPGVSAPATSSTAGWPPPVRTLPVRRNAWRLLLSGARSRSTSA